MHMHSKCATFWNVFSSTKHIPGATASVAERHTRGAHARQATVPGSVQQGVFRSHIGKA